MAETETKKIKEIKINLSKLVLIANKEIKKI